jgi:DNA repair protein RadC
MSEIHGNICFACIAITKPFLEGDSYDGFDGLVRHLQQPGQSGDDLRRKLAGDGPASLTDAQLLTLLLVAGSAGRDAQTLAGEVIEEAGGIAGLVDTTQAELCRIKGIGQARAAAVVAALELGRRALSGASLGMRLGSSAEVHNAFWPWIAQEKTEVFSCAMVDAKLRLIRTEMISRGTLTASIVHPREAFRPAVRNAASGVIFAHNHPSGDPLPSDEDRRITDRLEEVGRILGIPLLDHLIIGAGSKYYSFADAGDLGPQISSYRGMVLR